MHHRRSELGDHPRHFRTCCIGVRGRKNPLPSRPVTLEQPLAGSPFSRSSRLSRNLTGRRSNLPVPRVRKPSAALGIGCDGEQSTKATDRLLCAVRRRQEASRASQRARRQSVRCVELAVVRTIRLRRSSSQAVDRMQAIAEEQSADGLDWNTRVHMRLTMR
jgi:hypothetical protein